MWSSELDLGAIPDGVETRVLTRHGFRRWSDLYPARQQSVTLKLLQEIEELDYGQEIRDTLRMAVIGTAEMAGLLSRWDRYYLKSYESMAGHRFNFTLLPVEPNVWGASASGRGSASRRIRAFSKASRWFRQRTSRPLVVKGPVDSRGMRRPTDRLPDVFVVEGSSERMLLEDGVVDLILTDPPYHDDVQYGELSQPLRAWSGLPAVEASGAAYVNGSNGDENGYRETLTAIFLECRRVIRPEGHLIFSYANRNPSAWRDLFSALQ